MKLRDLFEKTSMKDYRRDASRAIGEFLDKLHHAARMGKLPSLPVIERAFTAYLKPEYDKITQAYPLYYDSIIGPQPVPDGWLTFTVSSTDKHHTGMFFPNITPEHQEVQTVIHFPADIADPHWWEGEVEKKKRDLRDRMTGTFIHEMNHFIQASKSGTGHFADQTRYGEKAGRDHLDPFISSHEIDSYALDVAADLHNLIRDGVYTRAQIAAMLKTSGGLSTLGMRIPYLDMIYRLWKELRTESPYLKANPQQVRLGKDLYGGFMKKLLFHFGERDFNVRKITYRKPKGTLEKWISRLLGDGR